MIPTGIGIFIAVINYIFRSIMIASTGLLKPATFTDEMNYVKLAIYCVTFFNSGLLVIAIGAYSNTFILRYIFRGPYGDFTPEWYNDIGQIIFVSLCINAFFPVIELFLTIMMERVKKSRDQGRWRNLEEFPEKTKC